jgi:RimJ/RimL family protein N-acetyltransferase
MKIKNVKLNNLFLRPLKLSDAPIFISWFADKEVVKYLMLQKSPSISEEKKWITTQIKSKNSYVWSILDNKKSLVGNINLRYENKNKLAHLGVVIGEKTAWGRGYGRQAMQFMIDFAFKNLKCNRVELMVFSNNIRAKKLYKKLGFVLEGKQRQKHYNLITKKFEDDEIYSILRREYKK